METAIEQPVTAKGNARFSLERHVVGDRHIALNFINRIPLWRNLVLGFSWKQPHQGLLPAGREAG